jgi:hypothetical protein
MTRTTTKLAAACAAVLALTGATALSANATYLGYGNGDPGNWDLWTEQAGGPAKTQAMAVQGPVHQMHHAHHAIAKHPQTATHQAKKSTTG